MTDNIINFSRGSDGRSNDRQSNDSPVINRAAHEDPLRQEFLKSIGTSEIAPDGRAPLKTLQEILKSGYGPASEFKDPREFKIRPEFTDPPEFLHGFSHRQFTLEEKPQAKPATPERIEQVRSTMEKSVNDLIPDSQKATLKQLRDGVLDAKPAAIEKAFEGMKDNPKLLHAMVKELNNEFKQQGSDVSFSLSDDNRLLVSCDGKSGIEFGAGGPEAKQVTRGQDGYIHLSQEQTQTQSSKLSLDKISKGMQQNASREDSDFLHLIDPYESSHFYRHPQRWHIKPFEPAHLDPDVIWDKAQDFKALHQ